MARKRIKTRLKEEKVEETYDNLETEDDVEEIEQELEDLLIPVVSEEVPPEIEIPVGDAEVLEPEVEEEPVEELEPIQAKPALCPVCSQQYPLELPGTQLVCKNCSHSIILIY